MSNFTRRAFIKASMAGFGTAVISTGLMGCSDDDDEVPVSPIIPVAFNHGVASGDPLDNAVIIWTRVTPLSAVDSVSVSWQVATDAEFNDLVHNGTTEAEAGSDFTVKIDLQQLAANTRYYYRFVSGETFSPVGMTKTLPVGSVAQVKLAVFSCANYPAGQFNAYHSAAKLDDLDAVVHLGDYIYEYGDGGFATENAEAIGRALPADNNTECITLEDYRKRYALYRSDTSLQQLHQQVPFITVWDDHEVTNDAWRDGAENHNEGEGDYQVRKAAGLQAYFEWLPIRPIATSDYERIFRSFQFGDLVNLHMLDTRLLARDEQLDYQNFIDPTTGQLDAIGFTTAMSANRSLLGAEQIGWLQSGLVASSATWQVLGQQILMGRMNVPAELLAGFANPSPALLQTFGELAQIKGRIAAGDPTVTEQERARVAIEIPYNLDAWDGYAVEREVVLGTAKSLNHNLVVLAGDTHNAWANNLTDQSGSNVGVEFATAGVSSPGLETFLSVPESFVPQAEQALQVLVNDLQYTNIANRGYMVVTFTEQAATAQWVHLDTVASTNYQTLEGRSNTLTVAAGTNVIQS
ncbi:alkaline phosphatase D family protein [Thalassotalea euphylliae]|uniref:Alkaline phosphatase n=1 Tax=Thalassotalea euphylliae TaxID=1655234 RepID=A0A3E0UB68_9GAMM|nr:alkaline phosphatase D family protein [Thalassotalea euphylliae]REL34248.1 alkaline phosphatase [Thalassotalea euphylliae]